MLNSRTENMKSVKKSFLEMGETSVARCPPWGSGADPGFEGPEAYTI